MGAQVQAHQQNDSTETRHTITDILDNVPSVSLDQEATTNLFQKRKRISTKPTSSGTNLLTYIIFYLM